MSRPVAGSPLGAILWAKHRIARHTIASVRRESRLKVAVVSVSAGLLALGLFELARVSFRLIEDLSAGLIAGGSLSELIVARLLSVFTLALFAMLIFSNVLISFSTLYRSREVTHLMQSPVSIPAFFLGRFYECVTFSSWASAFLGAPALLAYGIETGASPAFYLSLAVFYLPFVTIPAAIGSMITMTLVRLFAGRGSGLWAAAGLLAVVAVFGVFRGQLEMPSFAGATGVQAVLDAMGRTQSPFLPSYWVADGVLRAARGDFAEAGFQLLLLLANALFLLWLAVRLAEAWFYDGWLKLVGGGPRAGAAWLERLAGPRGWLGMLDGLAKPLPEPARSLVVKDLKLFWRDPAQWTQFVLFFGIMALYIANLRGTVQLGDQPFWRALGTLLNLGASMLILASLTTRFVYPLVSLEGRRFWILGLSPVSIRYVVWQKFWLSVGTTSIFTVGVAVLSAWRLELDRLAFSLSVGSVAATTLGLSGLAVGLGSLYPNFEEDNPARIVSGMGGTLSFILSMLYIALVAAGLAVVLFWHDAEKLFGGEAFPAVVAAVAAWVLLLTAFACFVPLSLGLRNLARIEI